MNFPLKTEFEQCYFSDTRGTYPVTELVDDETSIDKLFRTLRELTVAGYFSYSPAGRLFVPSPEVLALERIVIAISGAFEIAQKLDRTKGYTLEWEEDE